jgi:hypothetical protein
MERTMNIGRASRQAEGLTGSGPVCPALISRPLERGRPKAHIASMANKRPKQPTPETMKANALSRWEGEGGAPLDGPKPKRPRDLNQWAKRMVDIATGEVDDREPTPEEQGKRPSRRFPVTSGEG